jgi:hypothetical protein
MVTGAAEEKEMGERCTVCGLAIAEGEGRYRFLSRVVHVRCAESGAEHPVSSRRAGVAAPGSQSGSRARLTP